MKNVPDKPAIVYQAVNLTNGDKYIGITTQGLAARRQKHKSEAAQPKSSCRYFHAAIRKYGFDAFLFSELTSLPSFGEAAALECRLIALERPAYNITLGGEGTLGHFVSAGARARIADARRGKPAPNRGIPHSPETRAKIAAKATGRRLFGERLELQRAWIRKIAAARKRPTLCVTTGETFPSASEAARRHGWKPEAVASAISKNGGKIHGLTFSYGTPL